MNRVEIIPDQCKGCRLCVEFCPEKCISIVQQINTLGYQYAEFNSVKCTACGICYHICPEPGAITVYSDKETDKKK